VQPKLSRAELDRISEHYALDSTGVDNLLELSGARPGPGDGARFLSRMFRIGGILSLAAAVVFFVAANWSRIAVFGRFALLELLLLVCAAAAFLRPPPAAIGRAALFLAFIITGALLALFGQTYQTGADVHELFVTWALLGLPLAWIAQWSVTSAAWLVVLNTALLLFCGGHPTGGLLWALLGARRFQPAEMIIGVAWINIGLWLAFEYLRVAAVPEWVRRIAISCAVAFATWAGITAIFESEVRAFVLPALALGFIAIVAHTLRRRTDIYPLAVVMGSLIILSMVWIAKVTKFDGEGVFLFLAIWLIGSSTAAGRILTTTSRRWREEGAT
jgi:uncharacterized membrane protein